METVKIAICDDNQILLSKYETMLNEIIKEHNLKAETMLFNSGELLIQFVEHSKDSIDIIFLDILMNGLNGVETAKKARELMSQAVLIFLTSSEEYVFDTMGVKAMAYLMKDELTKASLTEKFLEAMERVAIKGKDVVSFMKDNQEIEIVCQDICFMQRQAHSYAIHQSNGVIIDCSDMSAIEKLHSKNFHQVHPQYIVGLRYIDTIGKSELILSDKDCTRIPLDKRNADELKIAFADFMLNEM